MVKMQIVIEKLFPRKRKRARIKSRTSYVKVVRFVQDLSSVVVWQRFWRAHPPGRGTYGSVWSAAFFSAANWACKNIEMAANAIVFQFWHEF